MLLTKSVVIILRRKQLFNINTTCMYRSLLVSSAQTRIGFNQLPKTELIQVRTKTDQNVNKSKNKEPIQLEFVDDTPKLTNKDRLKRFIANYGATAIIIHVSTGLVSLAFWYSVISFGVDISTAFGHLLPNYFDNVAVQRLSTGTNFAVAYGINKLLAGPRILFTIFITPPAARFFRKIGIIKKPFKHL